MKIVLILYAISVIGLMTCVLFDIHHKGGLTLGEVLIYLILVLVPFLNSVIFMACLLVFSSDIVIWKRKVK